MVEKNKCDCYQNIEDIVELTDEKREILSHRIDLSAWIEFELSEIRDIINYHYKNCRIKIKNKKSQK